MGGVFCNDSFVAGPLVFGGDLSIVCFPRERTGTHTLSPHMCSFSNFISLHCLIDLQLHGAQFTWTNKQEALVTSRINRFLISP